MITTIFQKTSPFIGKFFNWIPRIQTMFRFIRVIFRNIKLFADVKTTLKKGVTEKPINSTTPNTSTEQQITNAMSGMRERISLIM